jgi:hypothetical protein
VLSSTCLILWNIFLSRLGPYIGNLIGDHQYAVQRDRSTTDQIFRLRQVLVRKWEYNETAHQLFIDFKKAQDPVRREVLCSFLLEFAISMKQIRLSKYV